MYNTTRIRCIHLLFLLHVCVRCQCWVTQLPCLIARPQHNLERYNSSLFLYFSTISVFWIPPVHPESCMHIKKELLYVFSLDALYIHLLKSLKSCYSSTRWLQLIPFIIEQLWMARWRRIGYCTIIIIIIIILSWRPVMTYFFHRIYLH